MDPSELLEYDFEDTYHPEIEKIYAHIESRSGKILGYYSSLIDYPNLPPQNELYLISHDQHEKALRMNANHFSNEIFSRVEEDGA
jgi:hypothetical protein